MNHRHACDAGHYWNCEGTGCAPIWVTQRHPSACASGTGFPSKSAITPNARSSYLPAQSIAK